MQDSKMDRRAFLGVMAGAAATVAVSGLAGCAGEAAPGNSNAAGNATNAANTNTAANANTTNAAASHSKLEHETTSSSAPAVYMTTAITPAGLQAAYDALGFTPTGKVAVKVSTGEGTNSNYLRASLVGDFVKGLSGTIVECNTAYGGNRNTTEKHLKTAADHGFTAFAEVDIMDADGSMSLPVTGGKHLTEDLVGAHFSNYDSWVSLAHFKGHAMGGFGGAVKNCSIGIASSEGKALIHNGGTYGSLNWGADQDAFLESMAEASKAVADQLGDRIVYVNVMNRISVDCDCDGNPAEPTMADVGILASTDPVAVDQACVDLVYAADDGAAVVQRIESRNGLLTLQHAAEIGLGSREYRLVSLDA
ncbi:MAG: DUF362 domain-containing protein [Coriobacteriia bacterium]|nr:DUF362 domain-containing protein [Coriobacteriia bacterium]